MTDVLIDHARGCLIGALTGDAAGATLEFIGRKPSEGEVIRALSMCGGGVFRVAPGQITDDGELILALARAISGAQTFPLESVAAHYRAWYQSEPFDIGNATRTALSALRKHTENRLAEAMMRCAQNGNAASKANGALMRAAPLGLWSVGKSPAETIEAVCADVRLTHPHSACQWSSVAYVMAIRHLLLHVGDVQGAYVAALDSVTNAVDQGSEEVLSWLHDARHANLPAIYSSGKSGFVRIAFTYAFFHLLQRTSYETALKEMLSGGGDCDTNACIVGGLVGARVGLKAIPEVIWHPVVRECDTTRGRERPKWLLARDALELAETLVTQRTAPIIQVDKSDLPESCVLFDLKLRLSSSGRHAIEAGSIEAVDEKWQVYFQPPLVQIWRGGYYYAAVRMNDANSNRMIEFLEAWYSPTDFGSEEFWKNILEYIFSSMTGDWGGGHFGHPLVSGSWTRKAVLKFEGHAETLEDVEKICSQLRLAITTMRDGLDSSNA